MSPLRVPSALLTADMCCRALHASGRRPYDRSGFKTTMPTRFLRARALLAGCLPQTCFRGLRSRLLQPRQSGALQLFRSCSTSRPIMLGSQDARGPVSVGGMCRTGARFNQRTNSNNVIDSIVRPCSSHRQVHMILSKVHWRRSRGGSRPDLRITHP